MIATARPWRSGKSGLRVLARVTHRSAREGVEGVAASAGGPALQVRVRAVPDKGEANRAVEAVVAEWLGVAKACVSVAAGGKSRIKTLDIAGDPVALETRLRARLEQDSRSMIEARASIRNDLALHLRNRAGFTLRPHRLD